MCAYDRLRDHESRTNRKAGYHVDCHSVDESDHMLRVIRDYWARSLVCGEISYTTNGILFYVCTYKRSHESRYNPNRKSRIDRATLTKTSSRTPVYPLVVLRFEFNERNTSSCHIRHIHKYMGNSARANQVETRFSLSGQAFVLTLVLPLCLLILRSV